jgi:hypothetical protein
MVLVGEFVSTWPAAGWVFATTIFQDIVFTVVIKVTTNIMD